MLVTFEEGSTGDDHTPHDPSFGFDGEGERVWRHPSELGAMMAAANGIAPPAPRQSRRGLRLMTLSVTLGLIGVTIISLSRPGPDPTSTQTVARGAVQQASLLSAEVPETSVPAALAGEVRIERWADAGFAVGSGVLIFDNGYIATSRDLIAGATNLSVLVSTGERYEAQLVGADYIIDIAVLKIDAAMPAAPIADQVPGRSDTVHIADPWSGSAETHQLLAVDKVMVDRYGIHRQELLELDQPTSGSAEGAPIVNRNDEVVGLVVPVDDAVAFRYAIDINAVRTAAHQIIETGFVDHVAWLGIKGVDAQSDGVEVRNVATGSPADQIGIEVGDIVSSVARRNVSSMNDLHRALRSVDPGDTADVVFTRDGDLFSKRAKLGIRASVN